MKLVSQYGYRQATNDLPTLTAQKGYPVYLKDMVVVIPQSQASTIDPKITEQWGDAANAGYTPEQPFAGGFMHFKLPSPVVVDPAATSVHLKVSYVWLPTTPGAVVQEGSFTLGVNDYPLDASYFHAKSMIGDVAKYWIYRYGSGTYPTLDAVFTGAPSQTGTYFPFTYFRLDKQSTNANTAAPAYQTSKHMAKILGMDYDTVADGVNSSPDIADVESAIMMFGVPATSTNDLERRYLFDYFDNLHYVQDGSTFWMSESILSMFDREPTKKTRSSSRTPSSRWPSTMTASRSTWLPGRLGKSGPTQRCTRWKPSRTSTSCLTTRA